MDPFFYPVIVAGVLGGASAGLLGSYIVGMRIPFVGVCMSHAAMAGAIWGAAFGIDEQAAAAAAALATALALSLKGPGAARGRGRIADDVAMSVAFSTTMGITFLGLGLLRNAKGPMLALLWGNLLLVDWRTLGTVLVSTALVLLFAGLFGKEMRLLLISRSLASAGGVHERLVYVLFLCLCALTITVNLRAVGGLMVFSLISNPAAAAYLALRGYRPLVAGSAALGALSALGGFAISFLLDLPTGACIALVSAGGFGTALLLSRHRDVGPFVPAEDRGAE